MTKIAFYGASVTQQRKGYADCFAKLSKAKVQKFGFGGMHLSDAGICFVDKVVKVCPDICFVDWFSTWYMNQDDKFNFYIDAIVEKLQKIDCRVIFLFFPQNKDLNTANWRSFYQICQNYLKNQGVEYLLVDEILERYPIKEILRDEIHTTEKGSRLYAEEIFSYLQKSKPLPKTDVKPNIYSSLSVLPVKRSFDKELILEGNCHIQGFFLKIGPWSGIVEISTGALSIKENTWDRWCYFERDHFSFNLQVEGRAIFKISNESFDISVCKDDFDFSKCRKKLVVHGIYYYGGTLKVCTKGSRIGYIYALLMSKVFAVKHRLRTVLKLVSGNKND